jgi:hypothetical protein
VALLAFFHARAGGSVGVVAALVIAGALGAAALALALRGAPARDRAEARTVALPSLPDLARPAGLPAPALPIDAASGLQRSGDLPPVSGRVAHVATEIARSAVAQLAAPAASLLVTREGRLRAAGTAGDWGAARREMKDLAGAGLYDAAHDGGEPPEFALDPRNDWLPRLLALYGRPVPMERWHELSDVPAPLLPLAGLAASGVGVAVPLTHRRRLAGLWVLAQRSGARPYTDAELTLLHRLARDAARPLSEALDD